MIVVTNTNPFQFSNGNGEALREFHNHRELLVYLYSCSDQCLLVSPFMFDDFAEFASELPRKPVAVELITSCAPTGDDQLSKPFSIRSFGQEIETITGTWPTIGIDNSLHSKIYVFWSCNKPFAGIVTSANLTRSGLAKNHETGLLLTDAEKLEYLAKSARDPLQYVSLSEYQLGKLCIAAEIQLRNLAPREDREIGLTNMLSLYATPAAGNRDIRLRETASYYIKVSGVRDRPILPEDHRPFDEPHGKLTFAKSPGRVNLGDCLLEVAVGGACFLSYYVCASAVYEFTDEEKRADSDHRRWPYYVYANNLSLHYGSHWYEDPIYYNDVVAEFKEMSPSVPVTTAGKDHFVGAMQMGHSYISVTREFGEFARKRIEEFHANKAPQTDA